MSEVNATDTAIKLAQEHGIDLSTVQGTGADGRILKTDVQAVVDALQSEANPTDDQPSDLADGAGGDQSGDQVNGVSDAQPNDEAGTGDDQADDQSNDASGDQAEGNDGQPDDQADDNDDEVDDGETAVSELSGVDTRALVPVQLVGANSATLAGKAILMGEVRVVTFGHYLAARQNNPHIFAVRLPESNEFKVY